MQEIFGPVFTVLKFNSYDDVIEKSNKVVYGLGSSVWTKDVLHHTIPYEFWTCLFMRLKVSKVDLSIMQKEAAPTS